MSRDLFYLTTQIYIDIVYIICLMVQSAPHPAAAQHQGDGAKLLFTLKKEKEKGIMGVSESDSNCKI